MRVTASNSEDPPINYVILRHLFSAAQSLSFADKSWELNAAFSDPEKVVFTEYSHVVTGNTISCHSFEYDGRTYTKHLFTFKEAEKNTDE